MHKRSKQIIKYKKAISLVEVLISVMIISVVIVTILQIKQNNLNFLEKSKDISKNNAYISLIALNNKKNSVNKNIYLSDEIKFKDDDIRRDLKKVKIKVKDEELEPIEFSSEDYSISINTKKTTLSIGEDYQKIFYRFSLDD